MRGGTREGGRETCYEGEGKERSLELGIGWERITYRRKEDRHEEGMLRETR